MANLSDTSTSLGSTARLVPIYWMAIPRRRQSQIMSILTAFKKVKVVWNLLGGCSNHLRMSFPIAWVRQFGLSNTIETAESSEVHSYPYRITPGWKEELHRVDRTKIT